MILGTAANNSITNDMGAAKRGGDISDTNVAIPKLIGTPITILCGTYKDTHNVR
jgi:hypothetical protein